MDIRNTNTMLALLSAMQQDIVDENVVMDDDPEVIASNMNLGEMDTLASLVVAEQLMLLNSSYMMYEEGKVGRANYNV